MEQMVSPGQGVSRERVAESRERVELPEWVVESPKWVVESPKRVVELPRRVVESPRKVVESPRKVVESLEWVEPPESVGLTQRVERPLPPAALRRLLVESVGQVATRSWSWLEVGESVLVV